MKNHKDRIAELTIENESLREDNMRLRRPPSMYEVGEALLASVCETVVERAVNRRGWNPQTEREAKDAFSRYIAGIEAEFRPSPVVFGGWWLEISVDAHGRRILVKVAFLDEVTMHKFNLWFAEYSVWRLSREERVRVGYDHSQGR